MSRKTVEESLVFTILSLANELNKKGGIITNRIGLTTQQWLILLYLDEDPNIPENRSKDKKGMLASEIASAMNVSRPNVTNLIAALMDKGLITQKEDKNDRRKKRLVLTTRAKDLLKSVDPFRRRANQMLFNRISKEERESTLKVLSSCLEKIIGDQGT